MATTSDGSEMEVTPAVEPNVKKSAPVRERKRPIPAKSILLGEYTKTEEPKMQRRSRSSRQQKMYNSKLRVLKRAAKSIVFENVSLADRIESIQRRIAAASEERSFLLTKLLEYQASGVKPKPVTTDVPMKTPASNLLSPLPAKPKVMTKRRAKVPSPASCNSVTQSPIQPSQLSDVASPKQMDLAKGKRGGVKRIQAIPMNEDGTPVFPIVIGTLKVLDLGKIVHDRASFHSERYLLPVGYTSIRIYPSIREPSSKCEYTCKILDAGEAPLFEMAPADDPDNIVRGSSSSQCHAQVLRAINKARGKDATNTGSGPDFFGYGNPTIMNLIQMLPNSEKCTKYKMVQFEQSNRMAKGSAATSSKTGRGVASKKLNQVAKAAASFSDLSRGLDDDGDSLLETPMLGGLTAFGPDNSPLLFSPGNNGLMDLPSFRTPSPFIDARSTDSSSEDPFETCTSISSSRTLI